MFNQEEDEQQNQRRRRPGIMLLMIAMLILVPVESLIETNQDGSQQSIIQRMKSWPEEPQSSPAGPDLTSFLEQLQNTEYSGKWTVTKPQPLKESNPWLKKFQGRMLIQFRKVYLYSNLTNCIILQIMSDTYSDDGYLSVLLQPQKYNGTQTERKGEFNFTLLAPVDDVLYDYTIKLNHMALGERMNVSGLKFSIRYDNKAQDLLVSVDIEAKDLNVQVVDAQMFSEMTQNIILSAILTFSLFVELYAILRILNNVVYGIDSAEKYSLMTFMLLSMWDCTITSLSFSLSFDNERYFVVYLLPTFLACILFTVFEYRMVVLIFSSEQQHSSSRNFKFNMGVYASLILTYIIIIYTNLSNLFILALPFLLLPQLYKNASRGQQITFDINYVLLYAPRFLILLYLRGVQGNILNLQPSSKVCLLLIFEVLLMIGLQYLQVKYGSRILFPKFMLPKRYEYFEEEELVNALEEGVSGDDCAICLTPVHVKPVDEGNQTGEYVGKVMRTPCGHRFHGTCLVPWMQHKMDCPQCRSKLPPF